MEAFRKVQALLPDHERKKESGFVLFVGPDPVIIDAGEDRDKAIERAVSLLNEQDTIVFLAKNVASIGDFKITKDQLILTRKEV